MERPGNLGHSRKPAAQRPKRPPDPPGRARGAGRESLASHVPEPSLQRVENGILCTGKPQQPQGRRGGENGGFYHSPRRRNRGSRLCHPGSQRTHGDYLVHEGTRRGTQRGHHLTRLRRLDLKSSASRHDKGQVGRADNTHQGDKARARGKVANTARIHLAELRQRIGGRAEKDKSTGANQRPAGLLQEARGRRTDLQGLANGPTRDGQRNRPAQDRTRGLRILPSEIRS